MRSCRLYSLVYKYEQWPEDDGKVHPQQLMKSVVARRLMQSVGRVMAAYFSHETVFVYSPHQQQRIPPLHCRQPSTGELYYVYGHCFFSNK